MSTVRVRMKELGSRGRGRPVRLDRQRSLVALACVFAAFTVFAVFFEIGHMTRSTHTVPQAYGPQKLPATYVRAGIPQGLIAAPAIPPLVAGQPHRAQAPSNSKPVVGASATTPETTAPTATSPASSIRSSPAPAPVTPAPVQAPKPSAPVAKPHGGSSSGEGGSFDSSG